MAIVQLATVLKFLFMALGCITSAFVLFTTIAHGFPFHRDILTPWMTATLVDLYINAIVIGAWISYKQSDWISIILWMISLIGFRSIVTCLYISMQFLNMSSKDSTKDPIYHVLRRNKKKKGGVFDFNIFTVAIGRVLFGGLGCLMLGALIFTLITAGSPFHKDVLFPWLKVVLVDFYTNVVPLLVWIAYKELSFLRSAIWMVLLICLGSIGTCAYIVFRLFELESSDPMYLVLFNSDDRLQAGYEKPNGEKEGDSSTVEQTT